MGLTRATPVVDPVLASFRDLSGRLRFAVRRDKLNTGFLLGQDSLGVDSLEEALSLRAAGISLPIIILYFSGQPDPETLPVIVFYFSGQPDPETLPVIVFCFAG